MSADTSQAVQSCQACGATVYPEHIEQHTAGMHGGKLLCPHCLREQTPPAAAAAPPKIHGFSANAIATPRGPEHNFRRPMLNGSAHATRCRTFHCKLTDAAMQHLNEQINEWVDAHDDVEIKFANSTIGVIEGKSADQHLVITLFY